MTLSIKFTKFIWLSADIIRLINGIMRMSLCFNVSLTLNDTEHHQHDEYCYVECYYTECHYAVRLYAEYHYVGVIKLYVVMLSILVLSVVKCHDT